MTDFSPNRPHRWPALSERAFEVYHVGDAKADIRKGRTFRSCRPRGTTTGPTKNLIALVGVTMMRFIGPRVLSSYYKKVYDGLG